MAIPNVGEAGIDRTQAIASLLEASKTIYNLMGYSSSFTQAPVCQVPSFHEPSMTVAHSQTYDPSTPSFLESLIHSSLSGFSCMVTFLLLFFRFQTAIIIALSIHSCYIPCLLFTYFVYSYTYDLSESSLPSLERN